MTKEQALAEMRNLMDLADVEIAHSEADDVLCEVLRGLGYDELVDAFEDLPKWYA